MTPQLEQEIEKGYIAHVESLDLYIPNNDLTDYRDDDLYTGFMAGAKWAMERMKPKCDCHWVESTLKYRCEPCRTKLALK